MPTNLKIIGMLFAWALLLKPQLELHTIGDIKLLVWKGGARQPEIFMRCIAGNCLSVDDRDWPVPQDYADYYEKKAKGR